MAKKRLLRVFLCHSSADKPKVRGIYERLITNKVNAWLDEEKLVAGQNYKEEISKAIKESDVVLVFLSQRSITRDGFVHREINESLDIAEEKPEKSIFIIPARLEKCDVPSRLEKYLWVDMFKRDGYDKLLESLTTRAKQLGVQPPVTNKKDSLFEKVFSLFQKFFISISTGVNEIKTQIGTETLRIVVIALVIALVIASVKLFQNIIPYPALIHTLTPTDIITVSPTDTPTYQAIVKSSSTPTSTLTYTPTLTPTITSTSTPFPKSIIDNKGVEMIFIPEGLFTMGYNEGTAAEDPQRGKHVDAFYIDKYEVTNQQYSECVKAGDCQIPEKNSSDTRKSYYGNQEYFEYPVINVNWYMAVDYCAWRDARLPTEPEWEKAARGEDGRLYPWGNQISHNNANYYNYKNDTVAVGSYENGKSPYGVYDMAGNVREWVSSLFVEYPYRTNDGRENPDEKGARVIRGGAWSSSTVSELRTTYRSGVYPSSSALSIGFRCARSVPEEYPPELASGVVNATASLNCRSEPNINSEIMDLLQSGKSISIIERLPDSSWLLVDVPGTGNCWVSSELVNISSGNLSDLPVNMTFPTSTVVP